jgi:hypothetical protein
LEVLLGFPEDQEYIKSFREGLKVLIACRGGNKAGRFLEAAAYGMSGRRGIILIPEGRGGWGWHKFFGELRKASDFLCHGGLWVWFLVCDEQEGWERGREKIGFGLKKDRAFVCRCVEVGFGPCREGDAHREWSSFQDECSASRAVCS